MKRILLITYYFPPCGGAGVQRWLRFVRYLPSYGWQTTVITTSEGDYPVYDPSLCKKLPDSVKVIRTKTPTLKKFLKLFKENQDSDYPYGSLRTGKDDKISKRILYWMRLNLIVPDIRVIWNKIAYKAALNELRGRKYDLVVTSGPPHSTHLVGLELKKRFSVKWITDFRDPWTTIYYLQDVNQNRFLSAINKKLEKSVVEKSDLNIIVSQSIADNLPAGIKKVLTNGFDPEDFYNLETIPSSFFRAKYVGKLTEGQDTENPLKWLHELSKERKMGNIEFSFVGTLIASRNYDKKYPLIHMRQIGYVTHHRAISEMYNADLLLLFINNCPDNKGILTTKLFEYIGSKTFILGIGPVDSEAARILKDYKAGVMVDYNDKDGFCRIVSENYEKWGKRISTKNNTDITPLSSPEQTNKLIELIDLD